MTTAPVTLEACVTPDATPMCTDEQCRQEDS